MKRCKHCKFDIPDDAHVCGHCGRNQTRPLLGLVMIIVALLVGAYWYSTGGLSLPGQARAPQTRSR